MLKLNRQILPILLLAFFYGVSNPFASTTDFICVNLLSQIFDVGHGHRYFSNDLSQVANLKVSRYLSQYSHNPAQL